MGKSIRKLEFYKYVELNMPRISKRLHAIFIIRAD